MRSRSLAIRVAVTMVRRSPATGCWRASSVKQRCSMLSGRVDLLVAGDDQVGQRDVGVQQGVVAVLMAEPTVLAISTRQLMSSSSSW